MDRRRFVGALTGAAVGWPLDAVAQQTPRVPRIGILSLEPSRAMDGLYRGLRELGYVEGQNIRIECRFSGNDVGRAPALAQELVALKVDVIFASSSTYVEAARQATTSIPIVFANHNDPVGTGHVASLARPGGNITGVSQMATDLNAKQLQLLNELVPRVGRVAVLSNPSTPSHQPALKGVVHAAQEVGLRLHMLEASSVEQFETAFESAAKGGDRAMLLLTSPLSFSERKRIVALSLKYRVPTLFGQRQFAEIGGLISYGPDLVELSRRAATYIDKVLKGAKPADLPVEQPTIFDLVINLKTAKALGLTIPQSLLLRADEVIE